MVFSGNANPALAKEITRFLGIPLSDAVVSQFSDGEINIEICENVRGRDVFIVQPTCPPTHKYLMELILMVDALRRASAARITAVIPYFGYGRQDRRVRSIRVPISAKVVADMIANVGVDRVMTVDLHAEQIQGFFNCAVENVYGLPLMTEDVERQNYQKPTVVSPDIGGVVRARAMAKILNTELAIIDKRRPEANQIEVMNIIGEVTGRTCILIDDIVDTAGTLCKAAEALKERGASKVVAYCTHAVLSGKALANIEKSALDTMVVTNSIPTSPAALKSDRIRVLTIGKMLAEAMRRVSNEESISAMFD
ncbi:ribose-phosphate pyrophosphokinase [Porticoccus sp. Uisw_050_02]|uniref:ribose-phosphate pyrophosphokinase n=1 Tax=Porticoccus sp. Uisw_050_02 TaxID=3230978 RepID=UPI0039E8F7CF